MTLEKIENKYMCPKNKIMSLNKIDYVYEGQWLYLEIDECVMHVVKPFESIQTIANLYNVDQMDILKYNDIKDVFIGEKIYIKTRL